METTDGPGEEGPGKEDDEFELGSDGFIDRVRQGCEFGSREFDWGCDSSKIGLLESGSGNN